jgi:tetratricopeptide (TPR) repeat protein
MTLSQTMPSLMFVKIVAAELCADYALVGQWREAQAYARQALEAPFNSLLHGGLNHWYETEALLRGGEVELAQADVQQFGEHFGDNRRYQIPYLRCLAVLARWKGNISQAIAHLEEAHTVAEEIGLPGEQWQILAALAELYQLEGEEARAREALGQAAQIVQALSSKLDDEELRARFLAA